MKYRLQKYERLTLTKDIQKVLKEGKTTYLYPIKLLYIQEQLSLSYDSGYMQCGFIVSKNKFPRANKRNRLKRLMRESYRLQKHILQPILKEKQTKLQMLLIYTVVEIADYYTIRQSIHHILLQLKKQLS